jgi:hypothetical protein
MSISSKEFRSPEELERFWKDPFGHSKSDYTARAATSLNDFVAYCFLLSYACPHGCVDDDGEPIITDAHVFEIRDQFLEMLSACVKDPRDLEGEMPTGTPITIGDAAGRGPQLFVSWSLAPADQAEVTGFVLTLSGCAEGSTGVLLSHAALTLPPKQTGTPLSVQVSSFKHFNNVSYTIVKLWRLGDWCWRNDLPDVGRITNRLIDSLGDPYGDIVLLANTVDLFHQIQGSAWRSALTRTLSSQK